MYDLILFRKSILLVQLIDNRKNISCIIYIFCHSKTDTRSTTESELTRNTSMDNSRNWSKKLSKFFIISLSMNHYVSITLITGYYHTQNRYDSKIMLIITRKCKYLINSDGANRFCESISTYSHSGSIGKNKKKES